MVRRFVCDIGKFEDRYFAYIAAFGMFTDVAYLTDQQAKNIFGRLAYLFQGALELGSTQGTRMKVVTEDQIIEGDFIFGAVTNSHSIGGFKGLLTGEIYLDDGWLELLLIRRPKNAAELSELISSLLSQQFTQKSGVFYAKIKSVTFCADQPVNWTLDGEDGGAHRKSRSNVCRRRLVSRSVKKNRPLHLLSLLSVKRRIRRII